jgi:hypothetical protein
MKNVTILKRRPGPKQRAVDPLKMMMMMMMMMMMIYLGAAGVCVLFRNVVS